MSRLDVGDRVTWSEVSYKDAPLETAQEFYIGKTGTVIDARPATGGRRLVTVEWDHGGHTFWTEQWHFKPLSVEEGIAP